MSIVRAGTGWRRTQACFWKVCSAMSNARPVGRGRRLAILVHGGNRRSLVARIDADALRDIVVGSFAEAVECHPVGFAWNDGASLHDWRYRR